MTQAGDNSMILPFEFATSSRIIFGRGKLKDIGQYVEGMGQKALVVTGESSSNFESLASHLLADSIPFIRYVVRQEPTTVMVREGCEKAKTNGCDFIISIGGGSALDAGKAISALLTNEADVYAYLEVIGEGKPLSQASAPFAAIPTTAGTGTEVTRNAVLRSPKYGVKVSLRSASMLPQLALVDPLLSMAMPREITASTGLDALTQLVEPFLCNRPNPITDAICRDGIRRAARFLYRAFEHGDDYEARENMALAALLSGLTLANARLGAVHGFAGVIGGSLEAPHGAICARLMPYVFGQNYRALTQREPENSSLDRFDEVAQILTGTNKARALDAVEWLEALCLAMEIPALSDHGLRRDDFPQIIEKSMNASSMKGNPIALTADEMAEILDKAL